MRFLTYGRGIDTRRMREVLKFSPQYTTGEAFDDFVHARYLNRWATPQWISAVESGLLSVIGARPEQEARHA